MVAQRGERIPDLVFDELALCAASDSDQGLVTRDLLEAGSLAGGDLRRCSQNRTRHGGGDQRHRAGQQRSAQKLPAVDRMLSYRHLFVHPRLLRAYFSDNARLTIALAYCTDPLQPRVE